LVSVETTLPWTEDMGNSVYKQKATTLIITVECPSAVFGWPGAGEPSWSVEGRIAMSPANHGYE